MGMYAAPSQNVTIATDVTIVHLLSAATVRARIYDLVIGSRATADNAASYYLRRTTAGGSTTPITALALDPADPSAEIVAGGPAITTEPTYTAGTNVLAFGLNQRATFRWVANPGAEIVIAAAVAGVGLRPAAGSFAVDATIYWME